LSEEERRASEPGVAALVKLARAANVSVTWLATGQGPKSADNQLPDGYLSIPFYDLRASGGRIYTFTQEAVEDFIVFKESWLREAGAIQKDSAAFEALETLKPDIRIGDLVVMDQRGGARPTPGRPPWPIDFIDGGAYAVALEARVLLRRLYRDGPKRSGASAIVARAPGCSDIHVAADALNFVVIGRLVWSGGLLEPRAACPI
jgi:hypothetical protein